VALQAQRDWDNTWDVQHALLGSELRVPRRLDGSDGVLEANLSRHDAPVGRPPPSGRRTSFKGISARIVHRAPRLQANA